MAEEAIDHMSSITPASTIGEPDRAGAAGAAAAGITTTGPAGASADTLSLADASATLGDGRTLVADYVVGANNKVAQIRVIDPTTHQVIAESPPDTIARMQEEVFAYQGVANQTQSGF